MSELSQIVPQSTGGIELLGIGKRKPTDMVTSVGSEVFCVKGKRHTGMKELGDFCKTAIILKLKGYCTLFCLELTKSCEPF